MKKNTGVLKGMEGFLMLTDVVIKFGSGKPKKGIRAISYMAKKLSPEKG